MAKVLIVDDSSLIRKILSDIAQTKNIEIIEATNVDEAVDMYKSEKPDLVFMDIIIQNDKRTGIDALREIKKFDIDSKVIIVTSIGGQDDILQECIDAGAIDYFTKPFSKEEILESMMDYIDDLKE